jgi:hypothetical protein
MRGSLVGSGPLEGSGSNGLVVLHEKRFDPVMVVPLAEGVAWKHHFLTLFDAGIAASCQRLHATRPRQPQSCRSSWTTLYYLSLHYLH